MSRDFTRAPLAAKGNTVLRPGVRFFTGTYLGVLRNYLPVQSPGAGCNPAPRVWVDAVGRTGQLLLRDQRCLVANAAPSAKAWSLAHIMEEWTRGVKAPWENPQSVPAITFSFPTRRA